MGSQSSNLTKVTQTFMNNITQSNTQNCIATVQANADNNVVIANGVNVGGNFTGVATTASSDASCLMVSSMDTSVSTILAAATKQTNSTTSDLFGGFNYSSTNNKFDVTQSVTNTISQTNQATCAANLVQSANNNYVYVTNSEIGGNFIGVTSSADAKANCAMTNNMKVTTYNQAQASSDQSNTISGMWGALMAAIAGVAAIIIVAVIFLFGIGAVGYIGYSRGANGPAAPLSTDATLTAAKQLGLSPEFLASLGLGTPSPTVGTTPRPLGATMSVAPPYAA
jgi:hypothetical protein